MLAQYALLDIIMVNRLQTVVIEPPVEVPGCELQRAFARKMSEVTHARRLE